MLSYDQIKKYAFGYFNLNHSDLKHISEWEYVEKVDGLLMMQEEQRDKQEVLVDYIANFFAQTIVVDLAGKVKKGQVPLVSDVKNDLFKTTKLREEEAMKEWEQHQKSKAEKIQEQKEQQQQVNMEKAKLLQMFGIK